MIKIEDIEKFIYRMPRFSEGKDLGLIQSLDTEAYSTGRPFLYILDGHVIDCRESEFNFDSLFEYAEFDDKGRADITVYNLKYDSGAIVYFLPEDKKEELRKYNDCRLENGMYIQYIPLKMLKFVKGKQTIYIWDICQFYGSSLDKAAKKYLGKQKDDICTKKFTKENVYSMWKDIVKYCKMDVQLTRELSIFMIEKMREFGVRVTALYSVASLSYRYFVDNDSVVTVWRTYKYYRECLHYAIESYQGGKFEVTARGKFDGYVYDITSAYPYELRNLKDISNAQYFKSKVYNAKCKAADYGFIRCKVFNYGYQLPFGFLHDNVRIYPYGEFFVCITKKEYDYLLELGIKTEFINGYFIKCKGEKYPFRELIDKLFELKTFYKGKDQALYDISKKLMNSFYGKMVQCVKKVSRENDEISYMAGSGFNPIYASIITANTRLKVTRIQNEMKDKCLGVHTDSVLTLEPIQEKYITGELGDFELQEKGEGIIIACGEYCIGEKSAFKGFRPEENDSWQKILKRNLDKSIIPYPIIKVETWKEATAKKHFDKINLFTDDIKEIDINADIKRIWEKSFTCKDLTENLYYGKNIIYTNEKPDHWNNKKFTGKNQIQC